MATSEEQQIANEIVIAWLKVIAHGQTSVQGLGDPAKAGEIIGRVFQETVRAVNETTTRSTWQTERGERGWFDRVRNDLGIVHIAHRRRNV
jgi:hypothetical protein